MSEHLVVRLSDKYETVVVWLANTTWIVAEHTFKLVTWGIACLALLTIAGTSVIDPKAIWIIYALFGLWAAALMSASFKLVTGAQDLIINNNGHIPRWMSISLMIVVTGVGIFAIAIAAPAVSNIFTNLLIAPRFR